MKLLYYPVFLLCCFCIWRREGMSARFLARRLLCPGLLLGIAAYVLALLLRREQEYGVLYVFHILMGHRDSLFPALLWVVPGTAGTLFLYLLLHRMGIKARGKLALSAALTGFSLAGMHFLTAEFPLYLNMICLGLPLAYLMEGIEKAFPSGSYANRWEGTIVGALLLLLSVRLCMLNEQLFDVAPDVLAGESGLSALFLASWFLSGAGIAFLKTGPWKIKRKGGRPVSAEGVICLLLWLGLLLIPLKAGLTRIWLSDYIPINGDFQNYNVWRRLLAGQIPQRDFAAYLGMGHLYIGGILTALAGGSFTDSLFVSNTLISLVNLLFVYAIANYILRNRIYALCVTSVAALCVSAHLPLTQNLNVEIQSALNGISERSYDSMRMLRSFVILPALWGSGYLVRHLEENKTVRIGSVSIGQRRLCLSAAALLAGSAIVYSNDTGISLYLSVSVLFFLFLALRYRLQLRILIKELLLYGALSFLGFLFVAAVLTRGHLAAYLYEMLGTASYQKWYYGPQIESKFINIRELYLNRYAMLALLMIAYNIVQIVKKRGEGLVRQFPYAAAACMLLTAYINATFYLISSGYSNHALLYLLVFSAMAAYTVRGLAYLLPKLRSAGPIRTAGCFMTFLVFSANLPEVNTAAERLFGERAGVYFPTLEGYLSADAQYPNASAQDLSAAIAYVGTDPIFSTYASALETETGRYQPTGRDYIIHALGEKQQEDYLRIFREGEYPKVQTIDLNYDYGIWMMNANWFFYKEVFRDYVKTLKTSYSQFWEKAETEQTIPGVSVSVSIERFSEREVRLLFEADQAIDALADVSLSYESDKTRSFLESGNVNLYTYVCDELLAAALPGRPDIKYCIPNKMQDRRIPVLLLGGRGSVLLSAYPQDGSKIEIENAEVKELFVNPIEFPAPAAG